MKPFGSIAEPIAFVWIPEIGVRAIWHIEPGEHSIEHIRDVIVQSCEGAGIDLDIGEIPITEGVEGIAATDLYWDGEPTFVCANPSCRTKHNAHENMAQALYEAAKAQHAMRN